MYKAEVLTSAFSLQVYNVCYNVFRYLDKCLNKEVSMKNVFKALGDPIRREILELLKERSMSAGEISDHFDITKPSLSHHLSILKTSGLVIDERKGQSIIYSLNMSVFEDVVSWVMGFMEER